MHEQVRTALTRRAQAVATIAVVGALAACGTTPRPPVATPETMAPGSATLTVDDAGDPLPEGVTLSAWQEIVPGLRLRRGSARLAFGLPGVVRPQQLTAVEVDPTTPGLRFVTNPAGGDDRPARPGHHVHTAGDGLTDLLAGRPEVRVAINGNFFWPCCFLADSPSIGTTLLGIAVDGGQIVADPAQLQTVTGCPPVAAVPDDAAVGAPALLVDASNRVRFQLVSAASPLPPGVVAAVAGGPQPDGVSAPCGRWTGYPPNRPVPGPAFLLEGGVDRTTASPTPPEGRYGRSFVGRSTDGRRLYLATIDGSESTGAAFADAAGWLRVLGASDGLNLDGGGSSVLALSTAGLADPPASPCPARRGVIVLNVVDNGSRCRERQIGTYLGVVVDRPQAS